MDVAVEEDEIRAQVRRASLAIPGQPTLWARRTLLCLLDAAVTLHDLRTTASATLVRLSPEPQSGFRYSNSGAELYLYPIHPTGAQMSTSLAPNALTNVRAVKLVAIR